MGGEDDRKGMDSDGLGGEVDEEGDGEKASKRKPKRVEDGVGNSERLSCPNSPWNLILVNSSFGRILDFH